MVQRRFSIGVALTLLGLSVAHAQEPSATRSEPAVASASAVDIEERAQAIEQLGELSADVVRPLEAAKIALERFHHALGVGDTAGAARAERVARAAVSLAERRLSLERERTLLRAAQARRHDARARATATKAALDHERRRAAGSSGPGSVGEAP